MSDDTGKPGQRAVPRRTGRRQVLREAGAAGVGLAAGLLSAASPAEAANGNPVLLGKANSATAATAVTASKGNGLQGTAKANGASGVSGVDASTGGGYGVHGSSSAGTGVYGTTSAAGQVGVIGWDTSTGGGTGANALVSQGNAQIEGDLAVTGTVSKGGGSFKIDHPLDPAGKYLYHSFVESPDMKNVYDGTVVLDAAGHATVELPDWFEALNGDFRYQLNPIGSPAPGLHIAAEITTGRFTIAGGPAGLKVSWQVTGIRQDRWANAHRIPVEQDKPAADQGRYLHPDLYDGQPLAAMAKIRNFARRPLAARNRPA